MLIIINGRLGSGKTLIASLIASEDDRPIYSNYKLNLPNYRPVTLANLDRINEPSLVILDEIYAWANARIASSDVNLFLNEQLLQSRKNKLDIIGTLQLTRTLDVVFREMADIIVNCKKVKDVGFAYEFYDVQSGKCILRKLIDFELAQKIYPLYNTWQKVSSVHRYKFLELDSQEMNLMLDEIVSKLRPEGTRAMKKEFIRNWLRRNDYPSRYYTDVFDRLVSEA